MKRAGAAVRSFAKRIAKMAALAATAAAVGLVALTKRAFAVQDTLAKTAAKLGLTTEALAGLRRAAELSGVATNTLDLALQRMTRRVAEAAKDTGEAKAAIIELGLSAKELVRLSPDKQLLLIADAMVKVRSQSDRVRLGFKLFDSEGVALINTLAGGSKALIEATARSVELGEALSQVDARLVENANDAIRDMKAALSGVGARIAARIAPLVEGLAKGMTEWAKEGGGATESIFRGMELVALGAGQVLNAFQLLNVALLGVKVKALEVFNGLNRLFTDFVRNAITLLNKLPFVNLTSVALGAGLSGLASQERVDAAFADFMRLSTRELPSERVAESFKTMEANARAASLGIGGAKTALEEFLQAGQPIVGRGTIQFRTRRELGIGTGPARPQLSFAGPNIQLKVQQSQLKKLTDIEKVLITWLPGIGGLP